MILDEIVAYKLQDIAGRKTRVSLDELQSQLPSASPTRGFAEKMLNTGEKHPAVIAEVKRGSPSLGCIRPDLNAANQVEIYEAGGATAMSVLTDEKFFFGGDEDFRAARKQCSVPMLRKDFIIDPYQVYESRVLGADCLLLIMSILEDDLAADLADLAHKLGMDVLAETHSSEEILRVLYHVDFDLIGVNNRNLRTFETSPETTLAFAKMVPDRTRLVAESGLHTPEVIRTYWEAGISKFLVGEAFVKSEDPQAMVRSFVEAGER